MGHQNFRRHCIITGTGRTGTTFLVKLLTHLGLDTGFTKDQLSSQTDPVSAAGLEFDIRNPAAPYIVKSPWFCDHATEVVQRGDIKIDHVIIPLRDLQAAAQSRRWVTQKNLEKTDNKTAGNFPGGLWLTRSSGDGEQEQILLALVYNLLLSLAPHQIPVTLLHYPQLTRDPDYLYRKLGVLTGNIEYSHFLSIFNNTVDNKLVHQHSERDL